MASVPLSMMTAKNQMKANTAQMRWVVARIKYKTMPATMSREKMARRLPKNIFNTPLAVIHVPFMLSNVLAVTRKYSLMNSLRQPCTARTMTIGNTVSAQAYGLPQDWNDDGAHGPERYIEVQVWCDDPVKRYM